MKARTALAAMHWNANTKRLQAKTFDGTLRYQVDFKKANAGAPTVRQIKEQTSYAYAENLLASLFERLEERPQTFTDFIEGADQAPRPLAQCYDRTMEKKELVANYRTRFPKK